VGVDVRDNLEEQSRVVVVDDPSRCLVWQQLLPGCTVLGPGVTDLLRDDTLAAASAVIISASLQVEPRIWTADPGIQRIQRHGIELAFRLRQEPDRYKLPILLASFEEEETVRRSLARDRCRIDPAELLDHPWAHVWLRLPAEAATLQAELDRVIDTFRTRSDAVSSLQKLAFNVCKSALRTQNRQYRHAQGGLCAAVRILLGAIQLRDLTPDEGAECLRLVEDERRSRGRGGGPEYDFELVRRYQALAPATHCRQDRATPGALRVLLVDDQWTEAGWNLVLPRILAKLMPGCMVEGCSTREELLEIAPAGSGVDLILLDYLLGWEGMTGFHVLDEIRSINPFLPVILFTSIDQAEVFREALELGATSLFLKELADTSDRDSADYYRSFRKMIVETADSIRPLTEGQLVQLWKRVGCLHDGSAARLGHVAALADSADCLRRAMFFLTVVIETECWSTRGRRLRKTTDWAVSAIGVELGDFLEAVLSAHGASTTVERWDGTTTSGVWKRIQTVEQHGEWKGGGTSRLPEIVAWANRSRHGIVEPGDRREAVPRLSMAIDVLERCCEGWRVQLPRLQGTASLRPARKTTTQEKAAERSVSHSMRGMQAAIRFLLGCLRRNGVALEASAAVDFDIYSDTEDRSSGRQRVERILLEANLPPDTSGNEGQERVLLIDDTADEDGWSLSLAVGLDKYRVLPFRYSGSGDAQDVRTLARCADLLLLDLCLPETAGGRPSEDVGFGLLEDLREHNPGLPIVIFSAENDGRSARDCYFAGAQAYLPKHVQPLPEGAEAADEEFFTAYYDRFLGTLEKARTYPALRRLREVQVRLSCDKRYELLKKRRELKRILDCYSLTEGDADHILAQELGHRLRRAIELLEAADDPFWAALWKRVVGVSAPTTVSGLADEAVLLFLICVEFLVKLLIAGTYGDSPEKYHLQHLNRFALKGLVVNHGARIIQACGKELYDRIEALGELRSDARKEGITSSELAAMLPLLAQMLPLLSGRVLDRWADRKVADGRIAVAAAFERAARNTRAAIEKARTARRATVERDLQEIQRSAKRRRDLDTSLTQLAQEIERGRQRRQELEAGLRKANASDHLTLGRLEAAIEKINRELEGAHNHADSLSKQREAVDAESGEVKRRVWQCQVEGEPGGDSLLDPEKQLQRILVLEDWLEELRLPTGSRTWSDEASQIETMMVPHLDKSTTDSLVCGKIVRDWVFGTGGIDHG